MTIRFVSVACLAMLLAGCSLMQTSETPDGSQGGLADRLSRIISPGPQWSDYMPVQNGRVCTYTDERTGFDDTTRTWEYFNVSEESDGTHYTEEKAFENTTRVEGEDGETYIPPVVTETIDWALADDGSLRSEPGLFTAEVEPPIFGTFYTEYIDMSSDDFIVFPTIDILRKGESHSASATATGRATNPETQAEFDAALQPGESEIKLRLDYTVEGAPPKEITTPAGTFTDTVGVSITYENIEALNVNAEARSEFDEMTEPLTGSSSKMTTWYARDIGVVQVESPGRTASEAPPLKLEGCRP